MANVHVAPGPAGRTRSLLTSACCTTAATERVHTRVFTPQPRLKLVDLALHSVPLPIEDKHSSCNTRRPSRHRYGCLRADGFHGGRAFLRNRRHSCPLVTSARSSPSPNSAFVTEQCRATSLPARQSLVRCVECLPEHGEPASGLRRLHCAACARGRRVAFLRAHIQWTIIAFAATILASPSLIPALAGRPGQGCDGVGAWEAGC